MSRLLIVLGVVQLIVILALSWLVGPALEARLLPGVWIWDISVGGMTAEEAARHLQTALPLYQLNVVLLGPDGQRWSFSPSDLGLAVDVDATLAQAYTLGRGGSSQDMLRERLSVMTGGRRFAPVLVWDAQVTEKALRSLADEVDRPPQDAAVRLEGSTVSLVPGRLGRRVELTRALEALTPPLYALERIELVLPVTDLSPGIDDAGAQRALSVAERILDAPLNLLVPHPWEGDPGPWSVNPDVLAGMVVIRTTDAEVDVALDEAALAQFLGPLAVALYREPVDATFEFDPGSIELSVTSSSMMGREIDVAASVARINEGLLAGEHWIPLVVNKIPPQIPDTLTAEDLGIRELVAVGESYYTGSSSARDRNMRLGASKFDGVIVPPDGIFSFNEHLGDVTPDAGYDESYVIIGDRTVLGVGGGICQVSTTAFRAAYFGGYPIVERWPHAYRVGFYELGGFGPGFDATIYTPLVDFRFQNDTPHHILIRTEVNAAQARLRFLFYSTDDGRTVEQIGPEWGDSTPPGPPIYEYDASLAAGTVTQIERAYNGITAVLGRVVRDVEGTELYRDEFVSKFIPWSARYRYGPGYMPPADAEVVSTPEP